VTLAVFAVDNVISIKTWVINCRWIVFSITGARFKTCPSVHVMNAMYVYVRVVNDTLKSFHAMISANMSVRAMYYPYLFVHEMNAVGCKG
jgi:hypothetical protein